MQLSQYRDIYADDLFNGELPFWMKYSPDFEFGGWFGYCDRQGNLTHTCKGGNYKGFFHVPRALWFCCLILNKIV